MRTHFIDDRGLVVLLLSRGKPHSLIEDHLILRSAPLALFRLWNGSDEVRFPSKVDDSLGGLPIGIEFPMPTRILVGGIEDRSVEKGVLHSCGGII
jgi:hypothetical protein